MAQKTAQQTRLIAERVRALATILLTRREDVSIHEVTEDFGLDLIATINHEEKPGLRQFGVELRGVWAKVTAEHANAVLKPSMQQILRYGPFPFPVALFFYTMENGEGWYTWVSEPHISSDGSFELRLHGEASCRPLDDEAVDEMVGQVDAWYDAFYSKTSKEMPKKRKQS
jgi:hypothetical protein